MPKQEGTRDWKKIISGAASKIFKDKLEDFVLNMKERIHHTMKRITEKVFSSVLMIIAFVFLAIAFTFYLIEYQQLTKTLAFLITAGVIFLFSLIIRSHSKK